MTPEREQVLREQARTGMVDVGSLPDALEALDTERERFLPFKSEEGYEEHWRWILQLKARNAKLERVAEAALIFRASGGWDDDGTELDDALAALDATDE